MNPGKDNWREILDSYMVDFICARIKGLVLFSTIRQAVTRFLKRLGKKPDHLKGQCAMFGQQSCRLSPVTVLYRSSI